MELIGKGLFSKVYKINDKQVLIKSECYVKECLANSISNSWFPKLKSVDCDEYLCEYFPKVKSLKDSLNVNHYKLYLELKSLSVGYVKNTYDLYSEWYKQFETVSNKSLKIALIQVLDELSNYGPQIRFEISPRNVAVKNGKLILLDVFFLHDQADKVRELKRSKTYNR